MTRIFGSLSGDSTRSVEFLEDFHRGDTDFFQQIFHLKETSPPAPGGLDFIVSADEDFSPNKLRAQFERLYMGLVRMMRNDPGVCS